MKKARRVVFVLVIVGLQLACQSPNPPTMSQEEYQASQDRIEQQKKLAIEKRDAFDHKLDELERFVSPVRLSEQGYIHSKGVVVGRNTYGTAVRYSPGVIIGSEETASSVEEIKTAIQIICRKGAKVASYSVQFTSRMMPAYAINCRVQIIDTEIPAIVGRKDFSNKEIPENLRVPVGGRSEQIAAPPLDEIRSFIQALPRR